MQVTYAHRILIIDDTPAIHVDYRKVLGGHEAGDNVDALLDMESELFGDGAAADVAPQTRFEIDSALQGQDGLAMMKKAIADRHPYAMAFVDMRMPPGWDGVQTIRELWNVDPGLQIAICTAHSDYTPDQITKELNIAGRMLILRKPFDGLEVQQIATALCEKWSQGQRKRELEEMVEVRTAELKRAALHDALTGLPNRILFSDRLNQLLVRSRREPSCNFAVLFVDVDEFKVVNDSLGHEAGDALLLEIAARLNEATRGIDTVARLEMGLPPEQPLAARLGGDEFAILLSGIATDADAARVAQRILTNAHRPYLINGHTMYNTVSVGITTSSLSYEKAEDMLRDADTAMYQAKRNGRARFVLFDRAMHAAAVERLTFESDLRAALANGVIKPHYQPIVDIRSNKLMGFEALARWNHPHRGTISPLEFIAMAEETGLIVPLGTHILEVACRQLVAWQATSSEFHDLTMSVNISRKQLANGELVEQVERILRETGISPRNLKLEITESSVMADMRTSLDVLKRIQAMNVQLHIDDFGTGYSSLSCLQNIPLDGLKIDRGFISEITTKPDRAAILTAIITLARSLNLPLVSEGIETMEQSLLLRSMGCEFGQGYLYSKAMDPDTASQFISRWLVETKVA